MGWNFWGYYKPSRPRVAKGGIKSQSKRGTFGESWWAKRWIEVLESFNIGARLGRGRSYARSGQVLSIDIDKGVIDAQVQGSRPKPYKIQIKIKPLSPANWQKVGQALSRQAIFAAKLLAGEMPRDVEEVFRSVGVRLFPEKLQDLQTNCSCPDWSNPCKHIAAVYYLLGEEFDRDPFLIFKLRGISREEVVDLLRQEKQARGESRKATITQKPRRKRTLQKAEEEAHPPSEPLSADVPSYWAGGSLPEDLLGEVRIPPVAAALPKRLGSFPFWRGQERFLETLESIYNRSSERGMDVFLGTRPSPNGPA
jgi:uncharacterized Zn finger protein